MSFCKTALQMENSYEKQTQIITRTTMYYFCIERLTKLQHLCRNFFTASIDFPFYVGYTISKGGMIVC